MTAPAAIFALVLLLVAAQVVAHPIPEGNAATVQALEGPAVGAFGYLGAKHIVTGIDHVLFLVGVVFYLRRLRDVVLLATLFTLGHSITLMCGVWFGWRFDAALVDAVIGASVVYKAFENIGGFGGAAPNPQLAVFAFGLCHGLGLATRMQGLALSEDGLLANLVGFNLGVEVGQVLALVAVVGLLFWWRSTRTFEYGAHLVNVFLMFAGWMLVHKHLVDYLRSGP